MGAGTSPADPAPAGDRPVGGAKSGDAEGGSGGRGSGLGASREETSPEAGSPGTGDAGTGSAVAEAGSTAARNGRPGDGDPEDGRSGDGAPGAAESGSAESGGARSGGGEPRSAESGKGERADADPAGPTAAPRKSRRFPLFTRDTARPEGGGRAASGDAPAPARQWPLLSVISAVGVGLLIVALDPFAEAFRIGIILIGAALIAGAVLRWAVPSVGMLAVRSRFTDLVTYGLMGTLIVLLALVAQPKPWLDVPILEDAVRFTIR
ncbi:MULTISPECIES: DUF3017 domain-containing protein [Streptomyces]|uniref:DUF3017 domain-containing protein n=1 Tax=Streptomyces TaxID=1883 RepID=UPI000CD41B58|nr:DUF3017 domain-containing protein [Streptomyces sp. ZL-24]